MPNTTSPFQGACAAPFLEQDLFPETGGFIPGRLCSTLMGPSCCLPCPQTDWTYPNNFSTITASAQWINVGAMCCSVFLLLSFSFLPVEKTHRHYLSVCLVIATLFMQLGFIIPLGASPEQCFNEITPNDQYTSMTCAFSGAFLLAGGWAGVMWVFLRAVALHLQICWQIVIGKTFMWGALAAGWGIPAIGLTIALTLSGVSFRFGDTCHINHSKSLPGFWIPLLVFAAFTVIIQFGTFGYCIKVYLQSLVDDSNTTTTSSLPSLRGTISPRQAYRRVRRVIELQWRGIAIVLLIIADVIFFAIVFVFLDDAQQKIEKNPAKAADWLGCLIKSGGQKNSCIELASELVVNEATVMAVLLLLSMMGIWCLLFLGRTSMFTGWYDLAKSRVSTNKEFVSADAHGLNFNKDPASYEMLASERNGKVADSFGTSTTVTPLSPAAKSGRETPDYFGREARYKSPSRSFSSPNPPSVVQSWDSSQTFAVPASTYYTGMDPLAMNKI
ncbi:hypothetical protein BP6252_02580 [Coleophoma cylindrospora]|uniref:G-protein coupled receptors family 2 profile 2 domain-containing protein n=1 Tax=Coleophoma cylindrospora TaxID=1849047 RepID=A0A3D8SF62_9HELO|nr:hypothetical protein BP6252_02580 [Coleophoma cylindrospora]